jgi:glyoxylase-like metal-dependent hydrolase (beta-lactamase superfamily II)
MHPTVQSFHDAATGTVSHIVHEGPGTPCAIIDPVLDFDAASGRTSTHSIERLAAYVVDNELEVEWILETHAHADHLSGASMLRSRLGGSIGIGRGILEVRALFAKTFDLDADHGFDHLFDDGESFFIGGLRAYVFATPGHTPADSAYLVGDAVFVGDTLFMPDIGTARCDFPGGDADQLHRSIQCLLTLPDATRVFVCHDYPPAGRDAASRTSIGDQRRHNIHVRDGVDRDQFVNLRTARDRTLKLPGLIIPALQVNLRAGRLPDHTSDGQRYLKIPLDAPMFGA